MKIFEEKRASIGFGYRTILRYHNYYNHDTWNFTIIKWDVGFWNSIIFEVPFVIFGIIDFSCSGLLGLFWDIFSRPEILAGMFVLFQ